MPTLAELRAMRNKSKGNSKTEDTGSSQKTNRKGGTLPTTPETESSNTQTSSSSSTKRKKKEQKSISSSSAKAGKRQALSKHTERDVRIAEKVAKIAHDYGIYAVALMKLPIKTQKKMGVQGPITETVAHIADRLNERLTDDLIKKMNSDGKLPKVHFTRI